MTATKKKINILVVEDDEIDFMALHREFKKVGCSNPPLMRAIDGKEALEMLRQGKVDKPYIILVDLNMPRMGGLEFLTEVRNDPDLSKTVVFVLTTSKNEQDKQQSYEKNIAGYIVKEDISNNFSEAVRMINLYCEVVEFPS